VRYITPSDRTHGSGRRATEACPQGAGRWCWARVSQIVVRDRAIEFAEDAAIGDGQTSGLHLGCVVHKSAPISGASCTVGGLIRWRLVCASHSGDSGLARKLARNSRADASRGEA